MTVFNPTIEVVTLRLRGYTNSTEAMASDMDRLSHARANFKWCQGYSWGHEKWRDCHMNRSNPSDAEATHMAGKRGQEKWRDCHTNRPNPSDVKATHMAGKRGQDRWRLMHELAKSKCYIGYWPGRYMTTREMERLSHEQAKFEWCKGYSCGCNVMTEMDQTKWSGTKALKCPMTPQIPISNCCWLVGCLMSQQHASASQGRVCSNNFTCCHTEIEVEDQTFYPNQSQYTDPGLTSSNADPITPGAWCQFWSHWYDSTRKNPLTSKIRTPDLLLSRQTP